MNLAEWICWTLTETAKIMLITYEILGGEVRRGKKKYLVFLYLLLGFLIAYQWPELDIYYRIIWDFMLLQFFFYGTVRKKTQVFFLEYIVISCIDNLIWSSFSFFLEWNQDYSSVFWGNLSNSLGVLFWGVVVIFVRKYRKRFWCYFERMRFRYYVLLLIVLLCLAGLMANAQGNMMGETTEKMRKAAYLLSVMAVVAIIVIFCVFIYILYVRRQLEVEKKMDEKQIYYQKEYYEELLDKEESMRKFRHDFQRHINVLRMLGEKDDLQEMVDYLEGIGEEISEFGMIHVKNDVADYLISATIRKLQEQGEIQYEVMGEFPSHMRMSDSDLCVLLGNALENAVEALLKVEQKRKLELEIKSYNEMIFIRISNTANEKNTALLQTDKEDSHKHGYGTQNMRQVVEKYGGEIKWKYRDGFFVVEIEL